LAIVDLRIDDWRWSTGGLTIGDLRIVDWRLTTGGLTTVAAIGGHHSAIEDRQSVIGQSSIRKSAIVNPQSVIRQSPLVNRKWTKFD
jgi:hypothetical protein